MKAEENIMGADFIIQGGTVVSMVEGEPPLEDADVIIKDDQIIHIRQGSTVKIPGAEVIDASQCIVLPGLVNAHGHTAMTLFRGFADDLPLKEWLFQKIFPAESAFLSQETVYWGALLGSIEMIASGTTTVSDGYFYQDATARAFQKAGLRALVGQGIIDFPAPGVSDPKENLRTGRHFLEEWSGRSDLVHPGLFCHSLTTCSERTLQEAMQISMDFGSPLQLHLSETKEEVHEVLVRTGKKPVSYLEGLALLSSRVIAAHCVHLSDEEIELIARRGVGVIHCPESNMKLASGVAKMSRMLEKGVLAGLGTDGCASNNDLDLFQEMDTAAKLDKVYTLNPMNMRASAVLKMTTCWGARVLGLEQQIGTIEVGKKADLIVVDLRSPHLVPLYHPVSTIVYAASGGDVKDVMVNGKILMRDRRITHLDTEEVMAKVREISEKIRS